jgi:hypothetical protein
MADNRTTRDSRDIEGAAIGAGVGYLIGGDLEDAVLGAGVGYLVGSGSRGRSPDRMLHTLEDGTVIHENLHPSFCYAPAGLFRLEDSGVKVSKKGLQLPDAMHTAVVGLLFVAALAGGVGGFLFKQTGEAGLLLVGAGLGVAAVLAVVLDVIWWSRVRARRAAFNADFKKVVGQELDDSSLQVMGKDLSGYGQTPDGRWWTPYRGSVYEAVAVPAQDVRPHIARSVANSFE